MTARVVVLGLVAGVLVVAPVPVVSSGEVAGASGPGVQRVSVTSAGLQASGQQPMISANGRWVVFQSNAASLGVTGSVQQIFLRDTQAGTTTLVSQVGGVQGNGVSKWPVVSGDAEVVAFNSTASNLVVGDSNAVSDIFVWRRATGAVERVSVASAGTQANGESGQPAVSENAGVVAFESSASNLVASDLNGSSENVFTRNLSTGSTVLASENGGGERSVWISRQALSADGAKLVWVRNRQSCALTCGSCNVSYEERSAQVTDLATLVRTQIGVINTLQCTTTGNRSVAPIISPDGSVVSFINYQRDMTFWSTSGASLGVADLPDLAAPWGDGWLSEGGASAAVWTTTAAINDVYSVFPSTGLVRKETLDVDGGNANGGSVDGSLSRDGSLLGFGSTASDLLPAGVDTNGVSDAFTTGVELVVGGVLQASEFFGPNPSLISQCPCRSTTSDSIDTWTGNEHFRLPGLEAGGRGPGLSFELAYNSGATASPSPVGYGWSSTYDMSLTLNGDGTRTVRQETGSTVQFFPNGLGGWLGPARTRATLTESGGLWTFTRNSFETFDFDGTTGRLAGSRDRNGYDVSVMWDGSGRVDYVEHEDGRRLDFSYATNQVTITDPSLPTARSVVLGLNGSGDLVSYTDAGGGVYALGYDQHRLVSARTPRHASAQAPQPVMEWHYDAQGRADWEEDELNRRTTLFYDDPVAGATRRVIDGDAQVDYYTAGVLTRTTYAYGTADAHDVTYTYNPATLAPLTQTVDPGGLNLTTTYEYDARGNRTKTTDPTNRITRATWNTFDQPLTMTDAANVVTTTTYDANGNVELVQTASPSNPVGTRTIDPTYSTQFPGDVVSVKDERNKVWTFEYDAFGFPKKSITPAPESAATTRVNNRVGWPTSVTNPKNTTTTIGYNGYGQPVTTLTPDGTQTTLYWPGGLLKQVTDRSAQVTKYDYTDAGELTKVTRPDQTTLQTFYGVDGLMSSQVDGASAATLYGYDDADRLKTVTDPLGRVTTFGYDKASRQTSKLLPGGNCATPTACVKFEYFENGQLKKINYSDSTPDVTYTYDAVGRAATMADGGPAPSAWVWDNLGRLTSYNDPSGATAYQYDGLSNLVTKITYPGGKVVDQTYDNTGRMTSVKDWASRTTNFAFDANNNLDLTTFPTATGNSDDYSYDALDRMTGISFNKTGSSALADLTFYRSHYEGFLSAEVGSGELPFWNMYDYSNLDQLTTLSGNTGTQGTYTYDSADNLTGMPGGAKQRFDAANQLCYRAPTSTAGCGAPPTGATTYGYDNRGNRTTVTTPGQVTQTMTYDQANRMTTATATSNTGEYTSLGAAAVVLDTRPATLTGQCTPNCNKFTANETKQIAVAGLWNIPSTGVGAVVLNVTTTGSTATGWAKINRVPGQTSAAGTIPIESGKNNDAVVIAKVDTNGRINVEATVATHMIISVSGWYATSDGTSGSTFSALDPARIVDTRWPLGTCSPQPPGCIKLSANSTVSMKVTDALPVDAQAAAVYVGVLVLNPTGTGPGSVTINPSGTNADAIIDFTVGGDDGGTAIAKVDANGYIQVRSTHPVDIVIDIGGWFGANASAAFVTVPPARALDTRTGTTTGTCTPACATINAGSTLTFQITGTAGLPPTGMTAVVLNVTALSSGTGKLRLNPVAGGAAAAFFNAQGAGSTDSAMVIAKPDPTTGRITLTAVGAAFDVFIDTVGYFTIPQTSSYTYSGDGLRRTKTSTDGTITTYTWDHNRPIPLLLAENVDAPGTGNDKIIRYLYGPDGRVVQDITSVGTTDTPRWYHHDQLGTTRLLTDITGNPIGTATYNPNGTPASIAGATTNIAWAGEYHDTETGYTYLRARYYDPATAQFLTRDPIETVTREAYAYAGNNPINAADPTGLICLGSLCTPKISIPDCPFGKNPNGSCRGSQTVARHVGDIATGLAIGACVATGTIAVCATGAAIAFGARVTQRRAFEHGTLQQDLADAVVTASTLQLAGAPASLAEEGLTAAQQAFTRVCAGSAADIGGWVAGLLGRGDG